MGVGENEIGLAEKSAMYGSDRLAGVACGMYESDAHLRMVDEQAQEFAGCVAGASDDTYFFHDYFPSALLGLTVFHLIVVVDLHLVAEDLGEAFHVVGSPGLVDLALLTEVGLHEVEG